MSLEESSAEIPLDALPDRYAFLDPASTRKDAELKHQKARSAIVVVAPDWLGRVFVLDTWAQRATIDEIVDRIYATEATWKLRAFGVEANAMQELFHEAIARDARLRGKKLPLVAVHQPTRIDKDWRIRTV